MRSILRVDFIWFLPIIFVFIPESICKETLGKKYVIFDSDQINFEGNLPSGITFVPEQNIISAIKPYKGDVYVTIPRHGQTGIPATLAKVFKSKSGEVLFSPFPKWEFQTLGRCEMLQDVRSIEVDPRTDLMYIADNGDGKNCTSKLVIYDLAKKAINATYTLSKGSNKNTEVNNLGDVVVDNQGIVYIANSDKFGSLWIVNTKDGKVYYVQDHSFKGTEFKPFVFENDTYSKNTTINMLALTPDSKFLFYSANNLDVWQVKNDISEQLVNWRYGELGLARITGKKNHPGFDIVMGDKFLFFSNAANKSVSFWDRKSDLEKQNQGEDNLVKENEVLVNIQPKLQYFPGKMSLDEDGYLWIVTMDLGMYFSNLADADRGFRIVKVFVDNKPYNAPEMTVSSSAHKLWSAAIVAICCLLIFI